MVQEKVFVADEVALPLPSPPWDRAQAMFVITELVRSGLSVVAFAARHGVKPYSIYKWRNKLKVRNSQRVPSIVPVRLVEKKQEPKKPLPKPSHGEIDVVTPHGFVVRIRGDVDVAHLQCVLRALGDLPC